MAVNDYELINWQDGEVITSEKMNRMDSQIGSLTELMQTVYPEYVKEENTPYLSKRHNSSTEYTLKLKALVGGTYCWNQLVDHNSSTDQLEVSVPTGHIYIASLSGGPWTIYTSDGTSISVYKEDNIIDLTKMFGKTIAEKINALDDGVTWFRSMFSATGYKYNTGTLMNVQPAKKINTNLSQSLNNYHHDFDFAPNLKLNGYVLWNDNTNTIYYDGDEYTPDGQIIRKYAEIDLGDLTWEKNTSGYAFRAQLPNSMSNSSTSLAPMICSKYTTSKSQAMQDYDIALGSYLFVKDPNYIDQTPEDVQTNLRGVKLVYKLATPVIEQTTGFQQVQKIWANSLETFQDARTINDEDNIEEIGSMIYIINPSIPVGNVSHYCVDLESKINQIMNFPDAPTTDGNYVLTVTVTNGIPAYAWAAQTESEVTT